MSNIHTSATTVSQDLNGISNLAFQWKMIFNPDLNKQAQEVIFSRKIKKLLHLTLLFNDFVNQWFVLETPWFNIRYKVKLLGTCKSITQKVSKTMGLLCKFQQILPRSSLLIIYKAFIRSRLDYADIIYDQAYNSTFHNKLESIQYIACLVITDP